MEGGWQNVKRKICKLCHNNLRDISSYSSTVICSQQDRPKTTDAHAYASTYTLISKPGVRSLPDGTLFLTNWRIIPILFNYPKIFCTDISNCNMC